jgi:hypothetical protein
MKQNYINHIALLLDKSGSMSYRRNDVIKVADGLIKRLARRSQELGQETRVSVYAFGSDVECLIFDMDVLRLPSIATLYKIGGLTALIAATDKATRDLRTTSTIHGDHAFLTYVLTDGEENHSPALGRYDLPALMNGLADNETIALFVPDMTGKAEAMSYGFPKDNIAVWDTTNPAGVAEVGETIERATDAFMANRANGVRGSRNIFDTSAATINPATVQANLQPVSAATYRLIPVPHNAPIREFVQNECGLIYRAGDVYYQLSTISVEIQPHKNIMIVDKSDRVYTGRAARDLIGLPDMTVKVKGNYNPDYRVFVQSTSTNRKLLVGTRILVTNPTAMPVPQPV